MFHALRLCARVVIAVSFQKIDDAPHAETAAKGHYEGLQHSDAALEETHGKIYQNRRFIVYTLLDKTRT